eukprot:evm.model.scf_267.3 EVM.evm.TU.scf_267.3   scf_267:8466-16300(-)
MFGLIDNATFERNEADSGGGIYLRMPTEADLKTLNRGDNYMAIINSIFTSNMASAQGGALYTDAPHALDVCCSCDLKDNSTTEPEDGAEKVVFLRPQKNGISGSQNPCTSTWIGNSAGTSGDVIATTILPQKDAFFTVYAVSSIAGAGAVGIIFCCLGFVYLRQGKEGEGSVPDSSVHSQLPGQEAQTGDVPITEDPESLEGSHSRRAPAIQIGLEEVQEQLKSLRYNSNIMQFLKEQMKKARGFAHLESLEGTPSQQLDAALRDGDRLIEKHSQVFDVRRFYKTEDAADAARK